jgi:anaerobic magnesium-protoporphyrin IX monomethyl ester cyclase
VSQWDSTFRVDPSSFEVAVSRMRPLAIWLYTHPTTRSEALAMLAASRRSGAAVLVCGPDSDLHPDLYLRGGADAVIPALQMESATLRTIVALRASQYRPDAETLVQVPGIAFLDRDLQFCRNEGKSLQIDLEELPWPEREPVQTRIHLERWLDHHRFRSLALSSSQGCPVPCGFCSNSVFSRPYRRRSPDDVVAEMVELANSFDVDRLVFTDEVFLFDSHWLSEFAECLIDRSVHMSFEGSAHPGSLDAGSLAILVKAGLTRVELDAASGSDSLLRNLEWGYSPSDVYRSVAELRKVGVEVGLRVLVGLPGEGRADLDATMEMVQIIEPIGVEVTRVDPGSPALFRKDWQRVVAGPVLESAVNNETLPGPVLEAAAHWMSAVGSPRNNDPIDQAKGYLQRLRAPVLRALVRALPSWSPTSRLEWKRRRRLPGPSSKN